MGDNQNQNQSGNQNLPAPTASLSTPSSPSTPSSHARRVLGASATSSPSLSPSSSTSSSQSQTRDPAPVPPPLSLPRPLLSSLNDKEENVVKKTEIKKTQEIADEGSSSMGEESQRMESLQRIESLLSQYSDPLLNLIQILLLADMRLKPSTTRFAKLFSTIEVLLHHQPFANTVVTLSLG